MESVGHAGKSGREDDVLDLDAVAPRTKASASELRVCEACTRHLCPRRVTVLGVDNVSYSCHTKVRQ